MEAIRHLLFEDPVPSYILLASAAAIVLLMFALRRTRGWLIAAAVILGLGGIITLTTSLVTTTQERLQAAVRGAAAAVEQGDMATFASYLADDYTDGFHDRAAAARRAEDLMQRFRVRGIRLSDWRMQVGDSTAVTRFRAAAQATVPMAGDVPITTTWSLYWVYRDGQWLIYSAALEEPTQFAQRPSGPPPGPFVFPASQ